MLDGAIELLREWIGLDASTIGTASLARAIRGRMEAVGIADPEAFVAKYRQHASSRNPDLQPSVKS